MKAIITFHSIDPSGTVLSYPPDAFASLLRGLQLSGLPLLTLDQILKPETDRGVVLTFDDGLSSVYTAALPVLRDFKAPAHLFLTTSMVGNSNQWTGQPDKAPAFDMLSWQQLETLHEAGVRIESHTHTHPDLRTLSTQQIEAECEQADTVIKNAVGRAPTYFAYPYGYRNKQASTCIQNRYKAAVTTELNWLGAHLDLAGLPRLDSYYLRGSWMRGHLDSAGSRLYLALRSRLRSLKGSQ